MNKTLRVSLILAITVGLLLALTISGLAKKPDTFTLTYKFDEVNWDIYYAEGTFEAMTVGGTSFEGKAILHWIPKYGTRFGTMITTAYNDYGILGTIVFNFKIPNYDEDGCATGPVTIPYIGTGVFESYQGTGDIYMCLELQDDGTYGLYGDISGWVKKISGY
jgi:hypothetical protein